MKKKKYIKTILIIVLIILLLISSIILDRKTNIIENIFKTIVYPVNKLEEVKPSKKEIKDIDNLKTENETLKEELEVLKKELELKKTYSTSSYDVISSTVLNRNKMYWFKTLNIDKGSKDKIEVGNAVITNKGFIGKISKVYRNSSEVKLITSNDKNFKVSVSLKVNGKDTYGVLNGYDKKKELLRVVEIDKNLDVKENQTVQTSNLSSNYPSGIYIGEVKEVTKDRYDLYKILYIKTKQDFDNIHYVQVLKEKK